MGAGIRRQSDRETYLGVIFVFLLSTRYILPGLCTWYVVEVLKVDLYVCYVCRINVMAALAQVFRSVYISPCRIKCYGINKDNA